MTRATGRNNWQLTMSTRWAVYLGCTTPKRLQCEMGISLTAAYDRLMAACDRGMIRRVRAGRYEAVKP